MAIPDDRVYARTHEWHKVEGDTLTLGLTRHAVDQLTDITYAEMREPGTSFDAGEVVGEVESVKTTSDVYCACAGEIIEVNPELASNPGIVNEDPYGAGWLVRVRVSDPSGLESCLDAAAYEQEVAQT